MTNASLLTILLPSTPYILVYSVPLLLVSSLLAFAGAFLTLDRTRSFPPHDAVPGFFLSTEKRVWLLEGGVGGLSLGYVFGLHLSTFLSLLIPAISSLPSLAPKSFLAIWILSVIPATLAGGRWKYCALTFAGISGGAFVALSLSVIIHPSLLSRILLTAIITPTFGIAALLPFSRFQYAFLRFAASVTGSFGLILSIALLANVPGWANVWDRLWLSNNIQWGTGREKGLSTALCLFLCAGLLSDWVLRWKFGECPDQKWDYYLAKYASNRPDRAGTFQPLQSFWRRTLDPRRPTLKDAVFKADDIKLGHHPPLLSQASRSNVKLRNQGPQNVTSESGVFVSQNSTAFLKKGRLRPSARFQDKVGKRKEVVKFKSAGGMRPASGSGSESEDADGEPFTPICGADALEPSSLPYVPPPLGAVHPTPLLTQTLGRIATAQQTMLGPLPMPSKSSAATLLRPSSTEPSSADQAKASNAKHKEPRWDEFWKDVRAIATT